MTSLTLSFNEVNFSPVQHEQQIWLTASELSKALGYAKSDAVAQVYERNKDEFNQSMTLTLKLSVKGFGNGNSEKDTRIFSLRGCHLIAMFSKTAIAKQFRKWVLDILDKEVGAPIAKTHKSEREPLTNAVNMLVAKTKHLNYSDAYKLVHQRFNVKSIDEISCDAIPVAVEYVHHLIALYSSASKQAGLFDKEVYELVRELTESVLSQNFMMQDVWKALMLINQKDMMYYSNYVIKSNTLARKVSIELNFKTKQGSPLVDDCCRVINFSGGMSIGANPKWFNAQTW
ncbi:Bro-N domain-containing protein [Acinetobacter sichuanensis]|uniref:Alpha/beta hydrolase n=1 Tax=Acinetobacter sichuanensis TaxID=2136183 RepID=A0A371YJ34_9GAMM|nr:BRO family protein [Acinetobacter sichuanensis]RFC81498.1 alpha/beta hydrolase [Acinetobacter sichuanensis]